MTPWCLIVWPAERHRGADKEMDPENRVYIISQSGVPPSFWRRPSQIAIVKIIALNFYLQTDVLA